ncbi:Sec-independent protein translocase subunit TatA/TatB [Tuwongella immobilis]|uniref:Sec-independent protein translocase protein TatA n=1 Tax=Tuwongella immobilis TaxID=692036 RepID=A0A6C2YP53_9BACT|nr:twin-arginine translocase TatA/TatE family subunit [Tuwongella immobilis]VIP02913.1 primosome subunit : Sec-independent protein translocase protein TatA OS=Planctomyces maris DSM 8797 GN=tatA PE=3 SV=1: MttA_Hcf106 [Tuwongella immobilis]VTS02827.1 primosome subunit : Sec-independent protein translocase protein TatA OS=Planctomyces maris DSM 8797 GN=tatA PE=3 SV=1: MttA_Hcf106 [Tuwongella immobilis]
MFGLGGQELLILLVIGVVLFGRRLPEVGRSLGRTFVEFKKGVSGLEDAVDNPSSQQPTAQVEAPRPPQRVTPPAPKFDETNQPHA